MLLRSRQLPEVIELLERVLRLAESVDRALLEAQRVTLGPVGTQTPHCSASEGRLDTLRDAIEQRAHRLLARQPALLGSQLRTASTALTLAAELARIGEYAEGIAALAASGEVGSSNEPPALMRQMAYAAREMLQQAVRAVVVQDSTAVYRLRETREMLDALHWQLQEMLVLGRGDDALCILWIADNLERIAQRSVAIAEQATFIVTGILPLRAASRLRRGTRRINGLGSVSDISYDQDSDHRCGHPLVRAAQAAAGA
jgi:phosphate transport system protein